MNEPFDRPGSVEPVDGEVAISGPGRISGSLTPDAALELAILLQQAAAAARDQRRWPRRPFPQKL
jgi:hypothetical protein